MDNTAFLLPEAFVRHFTERLLNLKKKKYKVSANQRKTDAVGYAFLAPNLIGFLIFTLIPFAYSFYISFFKWDAIGDMKFVGLNNYIKLFKDSGFKISLGNTLYYTFVNVPLVLIFGMILALCIHKIPRCKTFFRTTYFLPNLVTVVSIAIVWQALYHPTYSPFSMILRSLGVENVPKWVSDTRWAMPCIIIMSTWINAGYYMVIFLAALNNIPVSLYEAASMDGANNWNKFWHITLPALSPTLFFASIIAIINSFKVFDQVALLTQGGPGRSTNVLVYYIYQQGFTYYRFGTASAAAYILFFLIMIVTIIQFKVQNKWAEA